MSNRRLLVFLLLTGLCSVHMDSAPCARAQNGRTTGTRPRVATRPESRLRFEEQERTVYRREVKTDYVDQSRTLWVPVARRQVVTRCVGGWNPCVPPRTVSYSYPCIRWEPRTETVRVPTTRVEVIPEKQTVKVPVLERRMVEVAAGETATASTKGAASTRAARRDPFAEKVPTSAKRPLAPTGQRAVTRRFEPFPPRYGFGFAPSPYTAATASRKWH